MSATIVPLALSQPRDVPKDAGTLCDRAAVIGVQNANHFTSSSQSLDPVLSPMNSVNTISTSITSI
jgi:hypothetical protein